MRCSLQDIFAAHFDSYAQQRSLHAREWQAAHCIRSCGTGAFGSQTLACPQGHFEQTTHHACRHRSCPRCSAKPRQLWLQAQLQRLLPCPHFHVVFTLPHQLLPLWAFNRTALATLLFACVRDSLLQLMADPRHLGVRPGLVMALHSWGRSLSQHPHVHCLISAGGIDPSGQWKHGRSDFLLPLKPLQHLFRGKLLAQLKALLLSQQLQLPPQQGLPHWLSVLRQLYSKHWNIEIQAPYDHARGVALYLARYVKGGPIPKDRVLSMDSNGLVRMGYTDHRDGKPKTLCLQAHEFIARVLWHAPPKGLHTVRYAGLYSGTTPKQYHAARQALTPEPPVSTPPANPDTAAPSQLSSIPRPICPSCQQPLISIHHGKNRPGRQISLNSQHRSANSPAHHLRSARPNTSFKPTADGKPPDPVHRYGVHCLWPGSGGSPPAAT